MAGGLSDEVIGAAVLARQPDPVVVLGPATDLLWANPAALRRFGYSLDDLRGRPLHGLVHPDDLETALLSLASVAAKDVGTLVEIRIRDASDRYAWFEVRGAGWDDGPVAGAVILDLRESTERRRWELSAGDDRMLGAILDATPTISILLDASGSIRGANRALTRSLHRPLEGTLERPLLDLVAPADRATAQAALAAVTGSGGTRQFEANLLTADGTEIPMSLTVVDLVDDDAVRGLVVAASDISSLVRARAELHHLASHDDLTGLPNRTHLRERLAVILGQGAHGHTLLFGDVDALKPINDRYGHRAGDAVLAQVAARLRSITREGDFVARVSGDEFVMLVPTTEPRIIADVRRRIDRALEEPVQLPDGTRLTVTMSTGAATTEVTVDADELLAAADAAMYIAKRERSTPG